MMGSCCAGGLRHQIFDGDTESGRLGQQNPGPHETVQLLDLAGNVGHQVVQEADRGQHDYRRCQRSGRDQDRA
jgi:hypothetical protein